MKPNATRLLNRAGVRQYTFAAIADKRPGLTGKMTRVSADFYLRAQRQLASWIDDTIEAMPSCGKTVR